jgi:hypothetical protein
MIPWVAPNKQKIRREKKLKEGREKKWGREEARSWSIAFRKCAPEAPPSPQEHHNPALKSANQTTTQHHQPTPCSHVMKKVSNTLGTILPMQWVSEREWEEVSGEHFISRAHLGFWVLFLRSHAISSGKEWASQTRISWWQGEVGSAKIWRCHVDWRIWGLIREQERRAQWGAMWSPRWVFFFFFFLPRICLCLVNGTNFWTV